MYNISMTPKLDSTTAGTRENLKYWIRCVDKLPDKNILVLDPKLSNLASAFEFGIISPATFKLSVKLLVQISPLFASLPSVERWIKLISAAINKAPEGHQDEICVLHNQLANLYSLDSQPKKLQESRFRALTYAIIAMNSNEGIRARLGIAEFHWRNKQYQRSKDIAQRVILDLGKTSDTNAQMIAALNILGIVAHTQKYYPEARNYFGKILKLYRGKTKNHQHAITQYNLAITHLAEENYAACLKLLAQSRRTLSHWPGNYWTMNLDYMYGITFLKVGELERAKKYFLRAIVACFLNNPKPTLIGHLYQCLGITLLKSSNYNLANIYLEKSDRLLNATLQYSPINFNDAPGLII